MVRYVHPLLDGAPSVLKGFVHLLDGMQSATPLSFVSAEHLVARYFSISSLFIQFWIKPTIFDI